MSRFALIPVRPGSFRPGSFRPNYHSLLSCFAQIIKVCSDYIFCPNMQINQPHRETDYLVTLATMFRDHAASLRIMLPADTTRRYDKNEIVLCLSSLNKPYLALLSTVFFSTKTSFEGAIFSLLFVVSVFFYNFFCDTHVFSNRAC